MFIFNQEVQSLKMEYRQNKYSRLAGSTEIVLVRHGESQSVTAGKLHPLKNGQGDPVLHPDGILQSKLIAKHLSQESIQAIYVTSLVRTQLTAEPLGQATGLVPRIEPRLREIYMGEWEGGIYRQMVAIDHPLLKKVFETSRWDVIPGAESNEDFGERVMSGIFSIAARHPDERVVAVIHGGVIGQIYSSATGADFMAFAGADNGSISRISVLKQSILIRTYNENSHLNHSLASAEFEFQTAS